MSTPGVPSMVGKICISAAALLAIPIFSSRTAQAAEAAANSFAAYAASPCSSGPNSGPEAFLFGSSTATPQTAEAAANSFAAYVASPCSSGPNSGPEAFLFSSSTATPQAAEAAANSFAAYVASPCSSGPNSGPEAFLFSSSTATPQTEDFQQQEQQADDRDLDAQDREQEKRDREQEARDREQEARDREEERRDREQERLDRLSELYDDGREALDDDHYEKAEDKFGQLAQANGPQADAALYWKAYAENRLGKRDSAIASIAELKRRFPQSRWQKDAAALELEVRQSTGQPPHPEAQQDDELRMLAIQGLMNSDPERAMPLLGKVLTNPAASPKEKSRALFVLAQSGSPQAREILSQVAKGQSNPDLQRKAIQYLGMFGGAESRKTLAEVYASSQDASVKRAILRSYMISGDKQHLFEAAKNEKDDDLKREAIRQLGLVHGQNELQQLYRTDNSAPVRRELLQAFFLTGDASKLLEVAQTDKDPELRRTAIRNLGLIHSDESSKALQAIYSKESDRDVKEEVLNAFFLQGNAAAIVAVARAEKDPQLRKAAVSKLSIMHSKEATDYLMEILQK